METSVVAPKSITKKTKTRGAAAVRDKNFAEFFAGIGLVGLGLKDSGWQCIYANDIDPKKHEIFAKNFANHQVYDQRDVWETEAIASQLESPHFLATASFPCIDLSLAGHGRGFDGKHSSTFFGFTKVVERLGDNSPKVILVENVPGFISSKSGADFRVACSELAKLGYWLDAFVLDARSFVPQSRQRVFIIGVHESVNTELITKQMPDSILDPWTLRLNEQPAIRPNSLVRLMESTQLPRTGWATTNIVVPNQKSYSLQKFIDSREKQTYWNEEDTLKHFNMLSERHRDLVVEYMDSGEEIIGTGYRRKRGGSTKLEVRFDGIAGCLRTPRGGSARQIVVCISKGKFQIRWMSPREYASLQGANQFKMLENDRQMLFGFGDAVCVPVIKWIDDCVLSPLYDEYRKSI